MSTLMWVTIGACVVASLYHFRETIGAIVKEVVESPGPFHAGVGALAAVMLTVETAHGLLAISFVAPASAVLQEYGERQGRVIEDLDGNVSEDVLKADFDALNRSAAKAEALSRVGEALIR